MEGVGMVSLGRRDCTEWALGRILPLAPTSQTIKTRISVKFWPVITSYITHQQPLNNVRKRKRTL